MTKETTYRMEVIDEPEEGTRSVLSSNTPGPTIKGNGPRTYQCGTCGRTLVRRVNTMQIVDIVFNCGTCGSFNEIPTAHQGH